MLRYDEEMQEINQLWDKKFHPQDYSQILKDRRKQECFEEDNKSRKEFSPYFDTMKLVYIKLYGVNSTNFD